jgi:glucan phosphoethanolaminetransferase (alkaline phosphatase superfamily)
MSEQPLPKEATTVFEEILGIPAHPLLVHGAVVFVPLLVVAAIAYAAVPFTRRYVWWAALALAVVAPGAAWAAKLSGQAFRDRLVRNGAKDPTFLADIDNHMNFGTWTAYLATILGVLTLLLVLVIAKRPVDGEVAAGGSTIVTIVSAVVIVAVAVATGYYVFRAGDTGAHIVWSGQ